MSCPDSLHEGVIQGYLEGLRCLHSLGPKKVWSYQGTVRYATNDILSALAGMAESGQVRMQREAKHDLVAFVKSFWAIQGERADLLNQIHASNIEGIRVFWAGQVADIGMGRKL
ncbi:hypothetical protein WJX77_008094 [Trebouxia sp. C0004]